MTERLYDPIRKCHVAATLEEIVRQTLLHKMIHQWGYPKGLLAVERQLEGRSRRFDIICYACNIREGEELSPLLVVECKAEKAREGYQQLLGYNAALGAPFLCIASNLGEQTFWRIASEIESVPFLPPYRELLNMVEHGTRFTGSQKD